MGYETELTPDPEEEPTGKREPSPNSDTWEGLEIRVTQEEIEEISELHRRRFGVNREIKELEHEVGDLLLAGAKVQKDRFEVYLCKAPPGVKPRVIIIEHAP